jgi:hypothetical protein
MFNLFLYFNFATPVSAIIHAAKVHYRLQLMWLRWGMMQKHFGGVIQTFNVAWKILSAATVVICSHKP